MDYRLGLDLGTNSIGWSIYSLNENKEIHNLENLGVRIFPDGRNPKTKEPLAVERRTARSIRKSIYRKKLRRKQTFSLLKKEGLFPEQKEDCIKLKALDPNNLRVKALDEILSPFELGRCLFYFSVRRGFKSNRKNKAEESATLSPSEEISQNQKCINLIQEIKSTGARTLGEYLVKNKDKNNGIRFIPGRMQYYPTRQLYIEEFNLIRQKQEEYYKDLHWDDIYNSIFYQRPLRVQERGKCTYMPEKERTFKIMPCAQKIRFLQNVYNLKIIRNGIENELLSEQRKILIDLLDKKDKLTFSNIKKILKLDDEDFFNLESDSRTFLEGNKIAVQLRKTKFFGSKWDSLSLEEQDNIVEMLITANEDCEVKKFLDKYEFLSEENKNNIIHTVILDSGTTNFCKEFTESIVNEIISKSCSMVEAIKNLGFKYANQDVKKYDTLPYYGKVLVGSTIGIKINPKNDEEHYGKISNVTVHIALNQVRTVINTLIKKYGKPTQIVIELSRDIKNSKEAKIKIAKQQAINKKRNDTINKNIIDAFNINFPNRQDRLKFRLWEELGENSKVRRCIYCGKVISGSELYSDNIQIEHILPYGRTLCDSENNKTLAHAKCNALKGERSPFEAFGNSPKGYNWEEILERANKLNNTKKKSLFTENAMDAFENNNKFIESQLTDNAYLSKLALKYLKSICNDVWSVNGGMTKLLRDKWDIDSILSRKLTTDVIAHFELNNEDIGKLKKNRQDHRHHALDAVVIALIDRSMVSQISILNKFHKKNRIEVPQMPILREELIEKVKNIVVSFKPDHGRNGKLSEETLLGKINFNGEECFVKREPVALITEKNLDNIIDKNIVSKIKNFAKKYPNEKWNEIMLRFSEYEWTDKNGKKYTIKKVRCKSFVQNPLEIIKNNITRYVCVKDYLCVAIWCIPDKKSNKTYKGIFYRRDEIGIDNKPINNIKPHPAAKFIGLLYKNDYLEFSENGKFYKCRIAGLKKDGRLDCRPIYATEDCKNWIISTNEKVLENCWDLKKGQNFISINVLFGDKKARFITVNPIGEVHRN